MKGGKYIKFLPLKYDSFDSLNFLESSIEFAFMYSIDGTGVITDLYLL